MAKKITIQFVYKEQIAPGIVSFYFIKTKEFQFIAGQYLQLTLPHVNPDEHGTSRFFTIASSPEEKYLMITTRQIVAQEVKTSFKKRLFSLQKGENVDAFGPLGRFYLPDTASA